jgi:hypothetical protein
MKPKYFTFKHQINLDAVNSFQDKDQYEGWIKSSFIQKMAISLHDAIESHIKVEKDNNGDIIYSTEVVIMTPREYNNLINELSRIKNNNFLGI